MIKIELTDWLSSPSMWKFSAYSYKKSAPAMPIEGLWSSLIDKLVLDRSTHLQFLADFQDISFEEARFAFYQARNTNQLNQYVTMVSDDNSSPFWLFDGNLFSLRSKSSMPKRTRPLISSISFATRTSKREDFW